MMFVIYRYCYNLLLCVVMCCYCCYCCYWGGRDLYRCAGKIGFRGGPIFICGGFYARREGTLFFSSPFLIKVSKTNMGGSKFLVVSSSRTQLFRNTNRYMWRSVAPMRGAPLPVGSDAFGVFGTGARRGLEEPQSQPRSKIGSES